MGAAVPVPDVLYRYPGPCGLNDELGKTIIEGFNKFLHPDKRLVFGVPPEG